MSWGAVIAGGAAIIGGALSNKGAKDAAKASAAGGDAAVAEQQRQFDLTRQDQQPWLVAGQNALATQQALLGGDYSKFYQSPEYQWTQQQGLQGIDRSAAARGGLYSGGADADRMKFAQGLASQEYGNFYNRLAGMSGTGQTAANNLAAAGQNYANNVGTIYQNQANARASAYQQQGDNWANVGFGLAGALNNTYQNNSKANGGGTGWYLGSRPGPG